jgi:hypothetical protein
MNRKTWEICVLLLASCGILWIRLPASAQVSRSGAVVIQGQYHGVSMPVPTEQLPAGHTVLPLRHPHPVTMSNNSFLDPVLQPATAPLVSGTLGLTFAGLGEDFPGFSICCAPPDTNASVGSTEVVETVNLSYVVFSKSSGALVAGPFSLSSLFANAGDNCTNGFTSDPVVDYDKADGRWVITFLAATPGGPIGVSAPFLQCIAVSQTSAAEGAYYAYAFDLSGLGGSDTALNDYPKLGVWPDAYYMAFNEFDAIFGIFDGASPCAFDRTSMLVGSPAEAVCFYPFSNEASLLPSDLDGATPPASGEPDFYVGSLNGSSRFHLWKFHVDFSTPNNSTFSGPTSLKVARYSEACGGGNCIPQPPGGEALASLGDRMMFRNAYRNFGGHESLVVSHSVAVSGRTGIRWYEVRNPKGTPSIYQQGTFSPDTNYRWMSSLAMDKAGDIALGYSVSSSSVFPSIRYTGRVPSDPLGTMEAEASIVAGKGVQFSTSNRWGDYSSMAIDPGDDCTFWYAQEYILASGSFNWSTRLASFKFPSCQ